MQGRRIHVVVHIITVYQNIIHKVDKALFEDLSLRYNEDR